MLNIVNTFLTNKSIDKRAPVVYNVYRNKREGNNTMKTVYVVPYTTPHGIRYSMHYTERLARKWGYRRMGKSGEHFTVIPMTEAQALALR